MLKLTLIMLSALVACGADTADDDHSTRLNDAGELDAPTFWRCTCDYHEPIFELGRYTGRDTIKQFEFVPLVCSLTPPIAAAACIGRPDTERGFRNADDPCTSCEPLSRKEADEIAREGGASPCVEETPVDDAGRPLQGLCL